VRRRQGQFYAGFLVRLFAFLIDLIIILAVLFVVFVVYGRMYPRVSYLDAGAMLTFMEPVIALLYFTAFEAGAGATPGKLFVGIRVTAEDGMPVGAGRAALRTVCKICSFAFPVVLLMPLWTQRRQALHDMMSYCVVERAL